MGLPVTVSWQVGGISTAVLATGIRPLAAFTVQGCRPADTPPSGCQDLPSLLLVCVHRWGSASRILGIQGHRPHRWVCGSTTPSLLHLHRHRPFSLCMPVCRRPFS